MASLQLAFLYLLCLLLISMKTQLGLAYDSQGMADMYMDLDELLLLISLFPLFLFSFLFAVCDMRRTIDLFFPCRLDDSRHLFRPALPETERPPQ